MSADDELNAALNLRDLVAWAELWLTAATRQAEQVTTTENRKSLPELMLFVSAVHNARRGARLVLGSDHQAVMAFDQATAGLGPVRNIIEHYDEYATGDGWRQQARSRTADHHLAIVPVRDREESSLMLLMFYGTGEDDPSETLEVPVGSTLAAVSALVETAKAKAAHEFSRARRAT